MVSSGSLNLMDILQEKLMKRMRTLWKLREEMKISLSQEANKTQSFEVRIKMFLFICIDIDTILDFRSIYVPIKAYLSLPWESKSNSLK